MPGGLVNQWMGANAVGPNWLPKIVETGLQLQAQRQRLDAQQQQYAAEAARMARQENFQERKFMYSMKNDMLDRQRQATLDQQAWTLRQAQLDNWKADNERRDRVADAQMENWRADNERQNQRWEWEKESHGGGGGMSAFLNWAETGKDTPAASSPGYAMPDALQTGPPLAEPSGYVPQPAEPADTMGGSDAGANLPRGAGGATAELLPPLSGNGALPLGPPIGEAQPPLPGVYAGIYGPSPSITNPATPQPAAATGALASHPGKEKYERIQRASIIPPNMVWSMKAGDRDQALRILGQARMLENDPDVLDYKAQLEAQQEARKQSAMDAALEGQFANDKRTAARQKKTIQHYYGQELPFPDSSLTPGMQQLNRGIPVQDWNTAAQQEAEMQGKVKSAGEAVNQFGEELQNFPQTLQTLPSRQQSTVERITADVDKRKAAEAWIERKGFSDMKQRWAEANPSALRIIAEVAKSGGTEAELRKRLDEEIDMPPGSMADFSQVSTSFEHPNPDKRGMGFGPPGSGESYRNFDIAKWLFEDLKSRFATFAKDKDGTTLEGANASGTVRIIKK